MRRRAKAPTQEHREIMEAIKAHEGERAAELAKLHMLKAYENIQQKGLLK